MFLYANDKKKEAIKNLGEEQEECKDSHDVDVDAVYLHYPEAGSM